MVSGTRNTAHKPARKQKHAKKMYVPYLIDCNIGGVATPMMKLDSQFTATARATPFDRQAVGNTSGGNAHPNGEYETPKTRIKRNAIATQAHPAAA